MQGYQASYLQDGGRSTRKENMLNKCPKQDFLPILVALLLEVVLSLLQIFHLDSAMWFNY